MFKKLKNLSPVQKLGVASGLAAVVAAFGDVGAEVVSNFTQLLLSLMR